MAAKVVNALSSHRTPMQRCNEGVTPFYGTLSLDTTVLDETDDKVVFYGPFPSDFARLLTLEILCSDMDTNGTPALVFDISKADDTAGTISSGGELIDGSTAGQTGAQDRLDTDNAGFDVSGGYLCYHTQTAAATPAAGTITFIGTYAAGIPTHSVSSS